MVIDRLRACDEQLANAEDGGSPLLGSRYAKMWRIEHGWNWNGPPEQYGWRMASLVKRLRCALLMRMSWTIARVVLRI